jgi:hypothetical protein
MRAPPRSQPTHRPRLSRWVGTILVVLLIANPPLAVASSVQRYSPPYLTGGVYLISVTNTTHCAGKAYVNSTPSANQSSGGATMSMSLYTRGSCPVGFSQASAIGRAGFTIPFKVATSGSHRVGVTWAVKWSANESAQWTCHSFYCWSAGAWVQASVNLVVIDLTNGSSFVSPHSPGYFVNITAQPKHTSFGSLTVALNLTGNLTRSHSYEVRTYIWVRMGVAGITVGTQQLAGRADFHMSPPGFGGSLLRASVS